MIDSSPRGTAQPAIMSHRRNRIARHSLAFLVFILCISTCAHAQSSPTASRAGDLQIGGGFIYAHSDYNFTPITLYGGAGYIDFANRPHWGGEFDFHQTKSSADSTVYERTYEIGPRIFIQRGRLIPYAKIMYGRGVYNFHNNVANVAYNIYTFGGGFDYELRRSINLRADYEYQTWMSFPITDLHPSVVTIGVAYHFHE
jgi:opacity protein-like surface antigen